MKNIPILLGTFINGKINGYDSVIEEKTDEIPIFIDNGTTIKFVKVKKKIKTNNKSVK